MPRTRSHRSRTADVSADTVIIGSGFGGCMVAHARVDAGEHVVMLERGGWATRWPGAWGPSGSAELTPHVSRATAPERRVGDRVADVHQVACVGGASVFYGGVSLRFREADFTPHAELVEGSGTAWPLGYEALEPHYARAERLLDVSGTAGDDPTAPWRSAPLPQAPGAQSATSPRIGGRGGRRPHAHAPAARHQPPSGRRPRPLRALRDLRHLRLCHRCQERPRRDARADLVRRGLALRPHTLAVRLVLSGDAVVAVEAVDLRTARPVTLRARRVVLAGGALASTHLVLASGLHERSPAREVVGRYLTRHCSAIAFGVFPRRLEPQPEFHKQLGFHDLYGGATDAPVAGPLGVLQQMPTPPAALVRQALPPGLGRVVARGVPRVTGLLAMAHDQSALPIPAAVNPSLTIAANALRIGAALAAGGQDRDGPSRLITDAPRRPGRDPASRSPGPPAR